MILVPASDLGKDIKSYWQKGRDMRPWVAQGSLKLSLCVQMGRLLCTVLAQTLKQRAEQNKINSVLCSPDTTWPMELVLLGQLWATTQNRAQKHACGTREMTKGSWEHAALVEDPGLAPSMHLTAHKALTLQFQDIWHPLLASTGTRNEFGIASCWENIHRHKIKWLKKFKS